MRLSLTLLLISVSVLAVAHYLALEFYLYWQYTWFDMTMHALGGVIIAFAIFTFRDLGMAMPSWAFRLPAVLLCVLAVGVTWEVFEVATGMYMAKNYALDTALDLCMDIAGGTVGYFVGSRISTL